MSDSSTAFAPPNPLLVLNLVAQIGFGLLAMTICLPSMQEWGSLFGADQSRVQLTFSSYLVAYGSLQLVYGPMSDRFGRKSILMFGLLLAGIGSVLAALATDLDGLTAARILQGGGTAAGMVAGRAMVQDLFPGSQRTRVMAYVGMATGLCPPIATLVGGQIHVRLGWQANFVLMAVLSALLLLWAWLGLPARPDRPPARTHWIGDMFRAYAQLAREPAFLMNVAVLSMTVATFYAFLSGAPIVLRSYGVGPADIGWYIMTVPLSFIVGNFLTSRLNHRFGDRRMMALGQASTVAGIGLMLALGLAGLKTPLAFCLPLMLLGIGHGLLLPACLAGAVGQVPRLAGAAAAVAGVAQQLMGALGGYTVGWVPHDGSVNLALLMMGFTLAAIAAQTVLHRQILPARRPG
ncbi:MAG: Bcr/CflA family efflux MFS transporter [Burkholderiaceae bacterium]|nr:Bcr/CflA family efflux MFS transporter [Burkholderiaceae bacterium]